MIDKTFSKFIIVGIINTAVGTSIMYILYNVAHTSYWFSSFMNYFIGSIVSFFLNKYFTFNNKSHSAKQIILFTINILFCYLVAYGIAKKLINFLLFDYSITVRENIAMFAGMVLFTLLNYFIQRYIVFKQK